jgi:ubiquinone biosynthesis protein UbiJ
VTAAAEFFAALPERLSAGGGDLDGTVIAFALTGAPEGGWTLRLAADGSQVVPGVAPADVTVTCAQALWEQLLAGEIAPQTAWATGRLEVAGDMRMAQRLRPLLGL